MNAEELMNLCGQAVFHACRNLRLLPDHLIVIADTLYEAPTTIKYKFGGSVQNHRGVRSIVQNLGGEDGFHRLLIGIGRGEGESVKDYVLGPLSMHEKRYWGSNGDGIELVVEHIHRIIAKGANGQ